MAFHEKEEEKMKRENFLAILIAALVIAIQLAIFVSSRIPLQSEDFYASANVTYNQGGFDLNKSALTFGNLVIGGSSTREIVFENNYPFPVLAKISASGEIADFLIFENEARVPEGGSRNISFTFYSPPGSSVGFYSGSVNLKIYSSR